MILKVKLDDIVEYQADALIYSTNQKLLMGGGVGASLLSKYGYEVQQLLYDAIRPKDQLEACVGDVFDCKLDSMPWVKVFHTVATNLDYETDAEIVKAILIQCLDICEQTHGIYKIAISALGCGYGDLNHSQFYEILKAVSKEYVNTELAEIVIVCDKERDFKLLPGLE